MAALPPLFQDSLGGCPEDGGNLALYDYGVRGHREQGRTGVKESEERRVRSEERTKRDER